MNEKKIYLKETVPQLLEKLTSEMEPSFGVMTPQHMVEHLIWVTKSSVKNFGPPPEELPSNQLKFMKFIEGGANFEYRAKDITREDLDPPRMENLSAAIAEIPNAIDRMYQHNEDHIFYNPMMGKLTIDDLETFHSSHFKWHLEEQFGLRI